MDAFTIAFFIGLAGLVVLDLLVPARRFPTVRAWRRKGMAYFAIFTLAGATLPFVWDEWLGEHRLVDATGLGTAVGALWALFVHQVALYAWHRSLHEVPFLWRWFHQMHHSAERVDVFGAYLFSPWDMIGFTFLGSFAFVMLAGVSAGAAAVATFVLNVLAVVQHANIRTPHWLGYLIQRPEGHAVHHQRGVHRYNYADLAWLDMLFGTWKNPRTWEGVGGFYDGASARVGDMLLGRDVSTPPSLARRRSMSQSGSLASAGVRSPELSPPPGATHHGSAVVR